MVSIRYRLFYFMRAWKRLSLFIGYSHKSDSYVLRNVTGCFIIKQ